LKEKDRNRWQQVLEKELNDIFQKMGLSMLNGGMVSIASVKITPDLYEARVYLIRSKSLPEFF